jgi:hypothetical protein
VLSFRFCLEQTSFLRITFALVFTSHSQNQGKCQNNFRIPFNFDHKLITFLLCSIRASSLYTSTHLSSHRTREWQNLTMLALLTETMMGLATGLQSLQGTYLLADQGHSITCSDSSLTDYRVSFRADENLYQKSGIFFGVSVHPYFMETECASCEVRTGL